MSQKTIEIYPLFKKNKTNKETGTVYLRVKLSLSNRLESIDVSTRQSILIDQWQKGNRPIKGSTDDVKRKNAQIRRYTEQIYALFEDYKLKIKPTKDGFKAAIDRELFNITSKSNEVAKYLPDLFPRYVDLHKNDLGKRRKSRYPLVCKRIKAYCMEQYGTENFELNRLNMEFHHKFKDYLITRYQHLPETYNAYLKVLDAVVRSACESGLIQRYPFEGHKYKKVKSNSKYLNDKELAAVINFSSEDKYIQRAADVFVFAAYTGLSYSDLETLTRDNIITNGTQRFVRNQRNKTGVDFITPLGEVAERILTKYAEDPDCIMSPNPLPVVHLTDYNKRLKRVGDKCGIKFDLTSHMARHTFATTVWLGGGGKYEELKNILGHTSIKTTERYGRIREERVLSEASKILFKASDGV